MPDQIEELRSIISDPQNREQLTELLAIQNLLIRCVLDRNYRLSDDWIRPLRFTSLGWQTIRACQEKYPRMKPNDAKMAAFLTMGCTEGLLVDISTDIDSIRRQLSREVLHRRIRYPYIFGRELHDAAAELFPAQTRLDNGQTVKLLNRLPIGVFQSGRTVVGPYGCTHSDVFRQASPILHVPGYRCPDESCTSIHKISLTTGDSAIGRAHQRVKEYIYKNYPKTADPYAPLVQRAVSAEAMQFSPRFPRIVLIDVIADGLDENELRSAIDSLLRRTFKDPKRKGDIEKRLGAVIANPSEFVSSIGRPELMQIALFHSDNDLIRAIDNTIHRGEIVIREAEVRVPKIRRWDMNSAFPGAQIGTLGVRFAASPSTRFVTSRMLHLLHFLYYESEFLDAGDLAYAIEAPNNLSPGDLLNQAVRGRSVEDLFRDLILPNRRAVEAASKEVGIFNYQDLSREQILVRLRWKIGELSLSGPRDLNRIHEYSDTARAASNENQEIDVIRAAASNLFAAVEDALSQALIFDIWALTEDHRTSALKFSYDPELDSSTIDFIESRVPTSPGELKLTAEKNTLAPLAAGFPRLAKALRNLNKENHVRTIQDIPVACTATSRPFAFPYTCMFFNLTSVAQADILTDLQAIGRHAQNSSVLEVRNWTSHGNKPFPGIACVLEALNHIDEMCRRMEISGLYPCTYELKSLTRDEIGREQLSYYGANGPITLLRPQWAIAPGLPAGQSKLIIIPAARTDSSGPLRFRLKERPGTDPYWDGWPKRWPTITNYSEPQQMVESQEGFADAG